MADFPPAGRPLGGIMGIPILPRIFITADPVVQTHYLMQTAKTLTGNFRVGALCVLPTAATTVTLHGQVASASNYFKVLSTGFASISIGGSVVTSTVLATKDNKLRTYDVELSGNDFLFQENGVTIDTVTDAGAAANLFVVDVLCQSNGADFFDGTYADPKITDLTTASNSVAWQLNLATGNTEQAVGGGNNITYNNAIASTRGLFTFNTIINAWDTELNLWTFGDGIATGSEGIFKNLAGVLTGGLSTKLSYAWEGEVTGLTSGELRFSIGDSTGIITATADGVFSGIDNSGTKTRLDCVTGATQPNAGATISIKTVRRVIEVA